MCVGQDDDRPLLRDRELLASDVLDGVSENIRVLETDVRQQDDPGLENVRRIEPAAETGLDDGDVDVRSCERGERRGGHDLELRRVEALRRRSHARDGLLEVGLLAVHPDPLAPAEHVRGDRRPDREPLGEQELLDGHGAVDFPFVPTTCTAGYAACGSPSSARSASIRPSPNSRGHGLSESSHSSAVTPQSYGGFYGWRQSALERTLSEAAEDRLMPRSGS